MKALNNFFNVGILLSEHKQIIILLLVQLS